MWLICLSFLPTSAVLVCRTIWLILLSFLPTRAMNVSARTRHMITTHQPLTEQQVARLERLRNRTTRHELAAINGDRKILVCYASRMSRSGILAALKGREARVDALVKLMDCSKLLTWRGLQGVAHSDTSQMKRGIAHVPGRCNPSSHSRRCLNFD
jgi:hypothetical protein